MIMENIITVQNLSKHFAVRTNNGLIRGLFNPSIKVKKAVENVSFNIARGEAVAFLGPNGAGKTTTTKMMTGLIYPSAGQVSVLGFTPFDRKKEYLTRIGLVMGNKSGLNWDLTPSQSFWLLKKIYGISDGQFKARIDRLTDLLEVRDRLDTQLRRLSLGERMKVELIAAILHEPEILFLDEPTIGLDIITKKNIRTFLRDIQQNSQTTLILTSHDMDDIEQVCDRVIIIDKGQKVYDDTLTSLTDRYKQSRYVRFIFDKPPADHRFKDLGTIVEYTEDTYLIKVEASQMIQLISTISTDTDLLDIHIESVPLEEIIAEIFRGGNATLTKGDISK